MTLAYLYTKKSLLTLVIFIVTPVCVCVCVSTKMVQCCSRNIQWSSTCLLCMIPWVVCPAVKKKEVYLKHDIVSSSAKLCTEVAKFNLNYISIFLLDSQCRTQGVCPPAMCLLHPRHKSHLNPFITLKNNVFHIVFHFYISKEYVWYILKTKTIMHGIMYQMFSHKLSSSI